MRLEGVLLSQGTNTLQSEIIFHCNAVLKDVIVPESIEIDVKWFVDGENVLSETFNAKERVSGVLTEKHWKMGQKVRRCRTAQLSLALQVSCSAQAKHNIVGARTESRR